MSKVILTALQRRAAATSMFAVGKQVCVCGHDRMAHHDAESDAPRQCLALKRARSGKCKCEVFEHDKA
jgi:hypothetical protein